MLSDEAKQRLRGLANPPKLAEPPRPADADAMARAVSDTQAALDAALERIKQLEEGLR